MLLAPNSIPRKNEPSVGILRDDGGLSELEDFVLAVAIPEPIDVAPRFEGLTDLDDRGVPQSGDISDVKPSHFVNMPHVENSDPIVVWSVPAILPLENGFLDL